MHWIDWIIVIVPIFIVAYTGFKSQKYVRGVSDFLTGGRVAGRYVLCVSSGEAGAGIITLIAIFESYYNSGFAYSFWGSFAAPIMMIMLLTGFCVYRFRETRAMTMGQFLEIRYSRSFRIFAAILQSISGIINYGIFPAIGARFLVYFCDLPCEITFFGWVFPTFAIVMAVFLTVAVLVSTMGGQITIMATDCIQGLLTYPVYLAILFYIVYRFSWFNEMAPALLNRPAGESLLNPYDIKGLRDFNLFYVMVAIVGNVLNRMAWSGSQGYNTAAINAHEQKFGAVLGSWRDCSRGMIWVLLAVTAFTFLNNAKFAEGNKGAIACRKELASKVFDDVAAGAAYDFIRKDYKKYLTTGNISPVLQSQIDKTKASVNEKFSDERNREPLLMISKDAMKAVSPKKAQEFETIFIQMRVPMAIKFLLPIGLLGAFCATCIFMLIATDATSLHSWGSILVQDLILPIRGKPFTPKQQLLLLRILIACVAVFAFFFSYFFGQVTYIFMFFAITGAIWLGGAGVCIVGGLYWKHGTTAGAWAALISGSTLAFGGILGGQFWPEQIYPWLNQHGLLNVVKTIFEGASAPFEPWIKWRVTPDSFPINGQEVYAITMLVSVSLYILLSLLTCRKPYNIDRMLHRGKYKHEGEVFEKKPLSVKTVLLKLVGIDEECTKGDKVLVWAVFLYSFVWGFLISILMVWIWNSISPWSNKGWANWFFLNNFVVAGVITAITMVWFTIGGTWDLHRLFKRLKENKTNILDDGRVIDNVSADDVALVESIENTNIKDAHRAEKQLEEALLIEHDDTDVKNLHEHMKKEQK